jgi:predicted  nucleic acid-binding Zn-ribbon protein
MEKRKQPSGTGLASPVAAPDAGSLKARQRALERQLDHAQRAYDRNGEQGEDEQLRRTIRALEQQIAEIVAQMETARR